MDRQWWDVYQQNVSEIFEGESFSCNPIRHKSVTQLDRNFFTNFGNSGANAISLAIHGGAEKVILIGYDCQKTNGKVHWHGDHVKGLGNATRIDKWHLKFEKLADWAKDTPIINASRETALTCFPKMTIYQALWR
jgi:hypothetical protein